MNGAHKNSSHRFNFYAHNRPSSIPDLPSTAKQPDVLEWLEKIEFARSGIWKGQEALKISSVLSNAHKKIEGANFNRASDLRARLQKSQERVEQLRNRMARAENTLNCLSQACQPVHHALRFNAEHNLPGFSTSRSYIGAACHRQRRINYRQACRGKLSPLIRICSLGARVHIHTAHPPRL